MAQATIYGNFTADCSAKIHYNWIQLKQANYLMKFRQSFSWFHRYRGERSQAIVNGALMNFRAYEIVHKSSFTRFFDVLTCENLSKKHAHHRERDISKGKTQFQMLISLERLI